MPTRGDIDHLMLLPDSLEPDCDADVAPAVCPSWDLTRAIHHLRLSAADACLRAREDARQQDRTTLEHWHALGRAQGYQKANEMLRRWRHPDDRDAVLLALERQTHRARDRRHAVTAPQSAGLFYEAYVWALECVLMQVREICGVPA